MALSQSTLKQNLFSLFNQMKQSEMSEADYADSLATIITDYIKTAQVKPGIMVNIPATSSPGSASAGSTSAPGELI